MMRRTLKMIPRYNSTGTRLLCFTLFLIIITQAGLLAQPVVHHVPPGKAVTGQNVPIQFSLTGYIGRVVMAKAYFRSEGETVYRSIDLTSQAPGWQGEIPGRFVRTTSLSYFISVLLDNQTILTWPAINPYNNPHTIPLVQGAAPVPRPLPAGEKKPQVPIPQQPAQTAPVVTTSDTLQLLSPEQDGTYAPGDIMIAVSFFAEGSALDPASVKLLLDGRDLSRSAEISEALISLSPPSLTPGQHTVKITARDSKGCTIPPLQFRFFVQSAPESSEPAAPSRSFQGHAYADALYEAYGGSSEGIAMSGVDFSGQLSSFSYRGTLFLTSLESRHDQPRNRFGFSIGNRLIGASVGDSYPQMHDLIITGKRVRGVTGYVHLGLLNVDMVYGQTQRAVQTTFSRDDSGQLTPLQYGTFSQSILGVRPSLGDGRVFQFGLTLAKIRDDTTSIKMGIQPKDNLVLGPDVKLNLFQGKVVFTGAAALSLLTQDISYGPSSSEDIKEIFNDSSELPFDPADMADILILNDSTVPLDPFSKSSLAWYLNLQLNHWGHALNIGYRAIGQEYTSLANPWLRKDLRGFYLRDRFRLYQNKLYFTMGYEQYVDNFSAMDGNPETDMRTLNYGLALFPGGIYPQLSFNLRDQLRDNHIEETSTENIHISSVMDTLITRDEREKSWYRDMILQINQGFQLMSAEHQLSFSYISSRNIDAYEEERGDALYSPALANRVGLVTLTTRYRIPFTSTISYSGNHSEGASFEDIDYSTIAFTGEYRWLNDRLNNFAELRRIAIRQKISGEELQVTRNQLRLGVRWNIGAGQSLVCEGQLWQYDAGSAAGGNDSQTDSFIRIRYDRFIN
jgi:hypothetical protein